MVVVDSSALIPLAWVGRLDLISTVFDDIRTTVDVRTEVLTEGKRGTAALDTFLEDVDIQKLQRQPGKSPQWRGLPLRMRQ
ncbi:hypothetical protein [Haloquadratum walsbyi]|jgi:hypothetical protein|uniref:Nucleic acid-binding protein, contains PIN domain protein n=1 Tax=Haloquadratum walsbyi J07HQW2 TaxID=1238425 RepID=U1PSG4_9EURY|nr:hypothetical protein [Haloquadratum walsbyi]ERG96742.1 MAG: hypothetical protein J07HQW2_03225 [Haloquadratum walsbyi J07HQW2]